MPIDLRSDTVTRPTAAMRAAMASAAVGDDVFGDDPSVNALEAAAAALLGKERALFVPSGTMANQLALRAHTRPGDEVILHAKAHIYNYESGAGAALAGVSMRLLESADGSLDVDAVSAALHTGSDPHYAPTTLVCFENTANGCGGTVLPQANIEAVARVVRPHGVRLHLDGARLMNAVVASGQSAASLAAPFDTVSLCLSKGLGAPVGSVLAGDRDAIARAYRYRKMYGGGMRQAGILAAAAHHALEHHVERLATDHANAQRLAHGLHALDGISVALERVQTNLVYFDLDPSHPLAGCDASGESALVAALRAAGVWITGGAHRLRAVTHLDVDAADIDRALSRVAQVLAEA